MEFVGKSVKKKFKGFGIFSGTVNSFDSSSGFFQIVYEDGDSEELDFHEVASLIMADDSNPTYEPRPDPGLEVVREKPRVGRPRKRRRVERKVCVCPGNVEKETLESNMNGNLKGNVDLNERFVGNLKQNEGFDGNLSETLDVKGVGSRRDLNLNLNLNNNGNVEMKNGIDLNSSRFDLNLNDTYYNNNYLDDDGKLCGGGENMKKRGCIDLNLDLNCDLDDNIDVNCKTQRRECGFDLNLGVDEEIGKDAIDVNCGRQGQGSESTTCAEIVQETLRMEQSGLEEDASNKELKEDHSCLGSIEGILEKGSVVDRHVAKADDCQGVGLEGVPEPGTAVMDGCQADTGSSYKQASGRRKRRKVINDLDSTTERVLRRSARRGSAKNHVSSTPPPTTVTTFAVGDLSTSPSVSAVTEEKPVRSGRKVSEEPIILPPKLQLPPSSKNLNLDGIAVLDIFSIYACLRSFSTLLFLSPFELEDFVAALKCQSASSLIDCIHVSILQTLRKHLEYLSNEGSESASECLRSLNWGFLDSITWPIFMVEYLLIHGSGLKCGFDLTSLKLFRSDYYKQPAAVKVEILQCLCDDMIEVEAIRSELNRRSLASESEMDFDRNMNIEGSKKRKGAMDVSGGSGLSEEVVDDTTDWNSDDCCLCKMDGSLICCDGCPAAYHSKCVGVVNALLPEGDWYCPECAIDRHKPWMKPRKSPRGAELLVIDPHGRLYYNSSGYLLVLDSYDAEYSLNYYHRDDLNVIIDVLKSSDILYRDILKAIHKQWDVAVGSNGAISNLDSLNSVCSETLMKGQIPTASTVLPPLASGETSAIKNETVDDGKQEDKEVAGNSGHLDVEVTESANLLDSVAGTEIPYISSEGSAETMQMGSVIHNFQKQGSAEFSNQSEVPGKSSNLEDCSLITKGLYQESKIKLAPQQTLCAINAKRGDASQTQPGTGYLNYYSFAQTASLVVEELMGKPSEKTNEDSLKSVEEIIAMQMKVILKKSNRFHWPDINNLFVDARKENCGWCFCCRYPMDDTDCLFKITSRCVQEVSKSEMVGLQSKWNKKGHVIDVICHAFSIENRLHGLLSGPWLNPQYIKIWHKSILKASDVASLKHFLLMLEANLHHLALSAEWMKQVDSAVTMGSASHVVTASSRASAKHGIARKRGRSNDGESNPTSNPAAGPSICWWRGGRVSRQLFNWKVLPRSLASKAARQGGGKKIPGILYPESSDFARRSKSMAWRAAVESSTSIEQLALQVRELDSNIRWDDIENTHALPILDKDFKKSIRLFKKCVVRRKSIEGDGVKYLLDFGKRRIIPDVVMRHGTAVEESSSERKKYWLNESYVPLHLLKSFEEKRIARKSSKMISGKSSEIIRDAKNSSKKRGFSYLFSKAERSEYYQCGHCNKDVLIREAVRCHICKGFFHKRHVRKSAGAIIAECTYTCHRCQDGKSNVNAKRGGSDAKRGKGDTKGGKTNTKSAKKLPQKSKKASTNCKSMRSKDNKKSIAIRMSLRSQKDKKVAAGVPLRRSPRKIKYISVQKKKPGRCKKSKQKSKKKAPKKMKICTSWQKKRTRAYHSYWLNGLRLSSKPDDERVMQFQRKMLFAPSEHMNVSLNQPKCLLCCEAGYASSSNYVACEICEEWFHGDAYGLNSENKSKIIGFRCHVCCKRTPPVCPNMVATRIDGSQLAEMQNSVRTESSEEVHGAFPSPCHVNLKTESPSSETRQGLLADDDECFHKEEQLGTSLETSQGPILEYKLESNGTLLDKKQGIDAQQISNNELKPNTLTSDEKSTLEESRINSGHITATAVDKAECLSNDVQLDSFETELASLGHDSTHDDLVNTATFPKSVADGCSAELHLDKLAASVEFLDDGGKTT
ncbi:DDT domain - like 4 [Theobroma cacao]|nr:DDT domain - like 3 [Theobroma cacao]WRX34287.1 DDT domain - like 4 [Theobroma cacao]